MTLEQLWNDSGMMLEQLWNDSGMMLEQRISKLFENPLEIISRKLNKNTYSI
jgi:hypothetical protein